MDIRMDARVKIGEKLICGIDYFFKRCPAAAGISDCGTKLEESGGLDGYVLLRRQNCNPEAMLPAVRLIFHIRSTIRILSKDKKS
ncbi:hypothetical protein GCM10027343_18580 [Noviherbaspirillum agri]